MQNTLATCARRCVGIALFVSGLIIQPAFAQGEDDRLYTAATPAAKFARYYAPYAIQAAAADIGIDVMEATKGSRERPAADGADVERAVTHISTDATFVERARKYLRSWRYQFGSEGYLRCFESEPGKPDPDCLNAIKDDRWTFAISGGPSFHVWARFPEKRKVACNEVSIAFRGTDFTSRADWAANLLPSEFGADDHYRQLRRNIDAIIKKIRALDCYRAVGKSQIVSVGHSLGGGLAQFAALANKGPHRIAKVFAFDPSPVTGFLLLDKQRREGNAENVEFDRVYQSGEILAWVRPTFQQFPRPSSRCVRTVLYDVSKGFNIIGLHYMKPLAQKIVQHSYDDDDNEQQKFKVPVPTRCGEYKVRDDKDDYDALPPDRGPGVASPAAPVRTTRTDPVQPVGQYARNDGFEFTPSQPTAVESANVKLVRQTGFRSVRRASTHQIKRVAKWRAPAARVRFSAATR